MPNNLFPQDPTIWSLLKLFLYAAFAAVGGVLGHVMRAIDKQEKIRWARACTEGIAAGFVGLLVLFVCQAMALSEQWTGVIVGVSGWLGANASIRMLETLIYKKLGISQTNPIPDTHKEPHDNDSIQ